MGNRFKLETVLLTHKTHQPLALATLISFYLGGQGQGLVALGVFAVLSSTYTTCMYH